MKKIITSLLIAAIGLSGFGIGAQTFTFQSNTSPGVVVSTNPGGVGVGVSTPLFNTVYTSDGYYDGYGRFHYRHHHHRHHKPRHHYRHHPSHKEVKAYRKAVKKHKKAVKKHRKAMKKYYKEHKKHHKHHKH